MEIALATRSSGSIDGSIAVVDPDTNRIEETVDPHPAIGDPHRPEPIIAIEPAVGAGDRLRPADRRVHHGCGWRSVTSRARRSRSSPIDGSADDFVADRLLGDDGCRYRIARCGRSAVIDCRSRRRTRVGFERRSRYDASARRQFDRVRASAAPSSTTTGFRNAVTVGQHCSGSCYDRHRRQRLRTQLRSSW